MKNYKIRRNVFSVSTDTHFTCHGNDHSDAISKITYTMIGDPSQTITRNFDVLDEATGSSSTYIHYRPRRCCRI